MQKILLADSSRIFTGALESALQKDFQVITCGDGQAALELLALHQPDILIINLMLPHIDGIRVLQETAFHPPVILAITMHMSHYVEQSVTALGIDYTMIAPSVNTVVLRLKDLLKQYAAPEETSDLSTITAHHLHLLGIPAHLDGYRQLCIAIPSFCKNPQQLLTKELYPEVAQLCGSSDSRSVEHSIRKAIQAAWRHKDNAIWRKYFTLGTNGLIHCPTNKEFICRLAEVISAGSAEY